MKDKLYNSKFYIVINALLASLALLLFVSINTQAATVSCSQLTVQQASNGNWYAI